jgi:hypothetical protein
VERVAAVLVTALAGAALATPLLAVRRAYRHAVRLLAPGDWQSRNTAAQELLLACLVICGAALLGAFLGSLARLPGPPVRRWTAIAGGAFTVLLAVQAIGWLALSALSDLAAGL